VYTITSINIKDFWGNKLISSDLREDINIYIGRNGTGKTTFIKIIHAILVVDLSLLANLDFSEVTIKLKKGRSTKLVSVVKSESDIYFGTVKYKIGNKVFDLPLLPKDMESRRRYHNPRVMEKISEARKQMKELINVCWLSVHRELIDEDDYRDRYPTNKHIGFTNPIDKRLFELISKLTAYRLQIQSEYAILSSEFQKNVLTSMLYSEDFDTFKSASVSDINLADLKDKLLKAYQTLGIKNINSKIDEHINKLKGTIDMLSNKSKDKHVNIDDIISISLYKRTRHIVNLSNKLDEGRNNIFEPIDRFVSTVNSFSKNKSFDFGIRNDGNIYFNKDNKNIDIESLSSGEKQLLILLTETLLQKNENFIFIADEPELSLHIEWQRELLGAITKLNSNAQIIVATHSPEIAGRWKNNVIRMEEIFHG